MEQPTQKTPPLHDSARASALIFNDAGEYLLHLRDQRPGIAEPGAWSLLGGAQEPHDITLTATIQRELEEEAGLRPEHIEPFDLVHAREDAAAPPIQVFAAHWNGDAAALHLTEGVMLHWFHPQAMHRLRIAPTTLELICRHAATRHQQGRITPQRPLGRDAPHPRPLPPAMGNTAALNVVGAHLYAEDDEGRVLLGLRHPDSAFAGNTWHFLAGHCEHESAVSCLRREAEEEAGLVIDPADVELAHVVHMVDELGGHPRLQLILRARRWTGEPQLREPDRCTAWRWWHPDGLPEQLVPYTRAAITGIRTGRLYTEVGWP